MPPELLKLKPVVEGIRTGNYFYFYIPTHLDGNEIACF
jgi:hypothetical protein